MREVDPLTAATDQTEPTRKRSRQPKSTTLPWSLPPRGLSREQAAEYIGVSVGKFDELVGDGRMPKPKRIDGRIVWDRLEVDAAFSRLPDTDGNVDQADDVWARVEV